MKKKIFTFVAVVIVLSLALAGCNMFTVDAEREFNQVVATVEYHDEERDVTLSADVTKQEFEAFFMQNFQTYSYYYGFTAEECADEFINILSKQKMLIMLASIEFTKANLDVPNLVYNEKTFNYDYESYANQLLAILEPHEQLNIKNATNKMFEDSFEEAVKVLVDKDKLANEDKDDTDKDEDALDARPVQPTKDDKDFTEKDGITIEDVKAEVDFFTANKPDKDSTEFEKEAYDDITKNLETEFRNYYYYLTKQAETILTTKYTEKHGVDESDDLTAGVESKYKFSVTSQSQLYKDAAGYKSALEGEDAGDILVHNGQYVQIKSILLKFTEEQDAILTALKEKFAGEKYADYIVTLREAMVFGSAEGLQKVLADMPIPVKDEFLGLTVNVSNPDYEVGDDIETAYSQKDVPFLEVIEDIAVAIAAAEDKAMADYTEKYGASDGTSAYTAGKAMYVAEKRIEAFETQLYLVNDDDGMFQGKDYVETPYEQTSDYVSEYTALVRQLLQDQTTAGASVVNATVGTVVVNPVTGKSGEIVETVSILRGKKIVIYTDITNNMSFIINDFGVHIVMLTNVTVDKAYNMGLDGIMGTADDLITGSVNEDFNVDEATKGYSAAEKAKIIQANQLFTAGLDAFVGFDEETGKAITVREKLHDELEESYNNDRYTKFEKGLFDWYGDDIFDTSDDKEKVDASVSFTLYKDNGLFKSIKKDFIKYEEAQESQQA